MDFIELWRRPWAWSARPGSTALRAANRLNDYVFGPRFRRHPQICNLAVFDVALHRRFIGRVELEKGHPLSWSGGQQPKTVDVALHQHRLKRAHHGTSPLR